MLPGWSEMVRNPQSMAWKSMAEPINVHPRNSTGPSSIIPSTVPPPQEEPPPWKRRAFGERTSPCCHPYGTKLMKTRPCSCEIHWISLNYWNTRTSRNIQKHPETEWARYVSLMSVWTLMSLQSSIDRGDWTDLDGVRASPTIRSNRPLFKVSWKGDKTRPRSHDVSCASHVWQIQDKLTESPEKLIQSQERWSKVVFQGLP